jgi:hypothetical protein
VIFVYPLISLIGNSAPGTFEGYLSMLETALFEDEAGSDFDFGETSLGGDSNAIEHSGGLSSVNKICNMSYGGHSAASECQSSPEKRPLLAPANCPERNLNTHTHTKWKNNEHNEIVLLNWHCFSVIFSLLKYQDARPTPPTTPAARYASYDGR